MTAWDALQETLEARSRDFLGSPGFERFYTRLRGEEQARAADLFEAAVDIDKGRGAVAEPKLVRILQALPDEDASGAATSARAFAEAMLGRIRHVAGSGGNLYLEGRPPGAQLRAFELLRLRTPMIPFAYAAGNRALLEVVAGLDAFTLLDVGAGRGGQVKSWLGNPAARARLGALQVVAVEPDSAGHGGALELAEKNVREAAERAGIDVSFHPLASRAEDLRLDQLPTGKGPLVANASLALHHTGPSPAAPAGRDDVLRLLHAAGAEAVVLVEPDSNHHTDDFLVRFLFAFRHYTTLSHALYALLGAADAELVFTEFFGPEVRNVIGHDGSLRTERHEESTSWVERLFHAGFDVDTPRELVPEAAAPEGFDVLGDGQAFRLIYNGVPLLSVVRGRRRG